MEMHYCDIFSDCFHCPAPFCPYEKLDEPLSEDAPAQDDENLQD